MTEERSYGPGDLAAADKEARVVLAPAPGQLPQLFRLLSRGFFVGARAGCSLREFLRGQLGISPDYVEKNIKIIFLNGSPVDDLDAARLRPGAVVALSAAMPGVVGAAMRRDGPAGMRSSISYKEDGGEIAGKDCVVFLKLFNLVMDELGEYFLRRGVYLEPAQLGAFLGALPGAFWTGCARIAWNGGAAAPGELLALLGSKGGLARLSIE